MKLAEIKEWLKREAEARREELVSLSQRIFDHPELAFHEEQACSWLSDYLEQNGFSVERGYCGLATAFRGEYGRGRPAVAFLAEYDALPGLGHACGHNLIAASAVGGAVAAKQAVDRLGGRVLVIGTPAEESGGGKALLVKQGGFADLDVAMMFHPGVRDALATRTLASAALLVEFRGKASHAAARPDEGVNALEALLLSFQAINALRQHLREGDRVNGIITSGGTAPNVIPDYASARFLVRAASEAALEEIKERVLCCFRGAAQATAARLEYRWGEIQYAPLCSNMLLCQLFAANLEHLGRKVAPPNPGRGYGSTDMGNVSLVVPSIHPSLSMAPPGTPAHSPEFAVASCSPAGYETMLLASKALALTAADLLSYPDLLARIREEFEQAPK